MKKKFSMVKKLPLFLENLAQKTSGQINRHRKI
jgi:hypothetical protein